MHLQDVSDRIEKESEDSELLMLLQKDSIPVVRGDWKVHLGIELQEGECQGTWELERDNAVRVLVTSSVVRVLGCP